MKKHTEGFYTVEAAILVPLVLLTLISFGILIRSEAIWENCIHCAVDESSAAAAVCGDSAASPALPFQIRKRIRKEEPELKDLSVSRFRTDYTEKDLDHLTKFDLEIRFRVPLPMGFTREHHCLAAIKYRAFAGRASRGSGLGKDGLENGIPEDPVLIFPQEGHRYHREDCSYARASFQPVKLDRDVREAHPPCGICHSETQRNGVIVYCFSDPDTAYHLGSCGILEKNTIIIDRTEAEQQGFTPCSRCCGAGN